MNMEADRNDPAYDKWGEPSLEEMTQKAIQILQKNEAGYFLMVEGAFLTLLYVFHNKPC